MDQNQQSLGLDKRFYDTVYAEVGGGDPDEVAAVASTFLNHVDKNGIEKALKKSSAYKLRSREYVKASTGKLSDYERQIYARNQAIIDRVRNPQFRMPFTHFENVRQYGMPSWAKAAQSFKDIGRQRFFVIKE